MNYLESFYYHLEPLYGYKLYCRLLKGYSHFGVHVFEGKITARGEGGGGRQFSSYLPDLFKTTVLLHFITNGLDFSVPIAPNHP